MKQNNVKTFFKRLSKKNPSPTTELDYKNNFTLLIAVVLSAQMTDVGVNKVTKKLFSIADTPEKIIKMGESKVKSIIKSINFFHTKARNIIKLSKILIKNFKSQVPKTRQELETLNICVSTAIVGFLKATLKITLAVFLPTPGRV